ncbi:MAG TPA: sirohydrochlorin cobaltochelatase, partial [Holophaga sp.]|nr:sirohydrochlorin cobaltochelatase [Holophaga sp.]
FGAMSASARETYSRIEADARTAFPDREIRWAFTATSLVARLKQRGEPAQTLPEAYANLRAEGFRSAAVQSLHLVPGEKHHEVLAEDAQSLRLAFGAPLLETEEDISGVAADLLAELPVDRPVLVVAHGNGHEPRYNAELNALGARLAKARSDVFLTRLEGDEDETGLEHVLALAQAAGKVHVVPFLLVAGDHVQNDILRDEPDSLKSRLNVPDFSCGEALGFRPWVRRRFLDRLRGALNTLGEA